jgi:translation initiation factor IF-3
LPIEQALESAENRGLDLVEVAPNAKPPVCRIMDYGKYKYQQQKKQQEARKKQTTVQIKEIKVRPKTDDHDFNTKVKHIRRFIEGGDRCKVTRTAGWTSWSVSTKRSRTSPRWSRSPRARAGP